MLKWIFLSLHKEFIGENSLFTYAVLSSVNENSTCTFMFLQGTHFIFRHLNISLHLLSALVLSLYLFSTFTWHSLFILNIGRCRSKVYFYALKDIIVKFINAIHKIFSFSARSNFF